MSKKPVQRVKHVPQRTCVGCREVLPKRQMIRIVRTADGVKVDSTGKFAGRGAYLHDRRECWERGMKGALAHALKTDLTEEDRTRLVEYMKALPYDAERAA
ncbi:MAG: YlxR family protein [Chloroflexota bacterium]